MPSNYEITQKLYESEKTLVYRANRISDGLSVILKMSRETFPTTEALAQIKRENDLLTCVQSEYIVETYGVDVIGERHCLVMEDCGGRSIAQYMEEHVMSLGDFLYIAVCLVEAVSEVHQGQLIHKNINPNHILYNPETKQVKLINFRAAEQMTADFADMQKSQVSLNELPYIAPEQTGRVSSLVDYRADYYALGATFYEMLAGHPPFQASDPMELVHAHIAKLPPALSARNRNIPKPVCDIVMKLLEKMPSDRYHSEASLKDDLKRCLREFQEHGLIRDFTVGSKDKGLSLKTSEALYGREPERKQLLSAFSNACSGAFELMLITGNPGLGKTSLVNSIQKTIAAQHGYYIYGKYDQYKLNVPYSALIQAFRALILQLLCESPMKVAAWSARMLDALGGSGQIIIDVIPEVELIIGCQAPVSELGLKEALNRFHFVFQSFISVFGSAENPLVLFLDDLQWADIASLKLLEKLMEEEKSGHILLIGAFRDNEVDAYHPLQLTLDKLRKWGVKASHIALQPLLQTDVTQLLCDSLELAKSRTEALSEICQNKTHGNPFFLKQFLRLLYERRLLTGCMTENIWSMNRGAGASPGEPTCQSNTPNCFFRVLNDGLRRRNLTERSIFC